ncbi:MAG: hypothetical protein A2X94_06955 [Bdellovibrionales bacterium GWB1_55_8]|nr:MAG: hypothetical protein A2X94_06955 [Bdellovibrionales bacterium GWB1_55_8]
MTVIAFLTLPFLAAPQSASGNGQLKHAAPIVLCPGEQRILSFPGLQRYALGADFVRATRPPNRLPGSPEASLLVKARTPGQTDILVWKQDGSIEKRNISVQRCRETISTPLETALSSLEEVEIYVSGGFAILRGVFQTKPESARIQSLLSGFPGKVRDDSRPSQELLDQELAAVNHWIAETGKSALLQTALTGKRVFVRGNVEDSVLRQTLEEELKSRFTLATPELASLPDSAPTVYFRVFLLELKKARFGAIGLSWPDAVPGAFRVTTAGIPRFEDLLQIDLTLEALEGEGSVKVLSRPELALRTPGEAELFAGGELPIQSRGRYTSNISWKPYGLTLKLKATHSTDTQVRLEVFTEVSHLDTAVASDSVPGIRSNRMKTQVDARFGKPLLLSGLLQEKNRENARGIPILRSIPVLGSLFGSTDYLQDKSELVAILLPLRAPPAAPESLPNRPLLTNAPKTEIPAASFAKKPTLKRRVAGPFPYRMGALRIRSKINTRKAAGGRTAK